MKFKIFVYALSALILTAFHLAEAQPPGTFARVGALITGARSTTLANTAAFREQLRELGYIEGQNLLVEFRYADGKREQLPAQADELVGLRVAVIAAFGAPAILAAKKATTSIPIVFETLADAVVMGFVPNLARPGGNITGVTGFASELGGKWLELLREVVPEAKRVALLTNPANPNMPSIVSTTESAARALGVQLAVVEVRRPSELDRAFTTLTSASADAVVIAPDPFFNEQRQRIVGLASKYRLPTISGTESIVQAGGLMFYGTTTADNWRRTANYVDKILKGANPADLPVERPVKFEFIINLKAAKQIGITIPPNVLARAD
ncbi:MAG TPA: ABC transporter substrate-binding protein, partial [Candidatus Binatia bacterium]|nr:ABC transporter substrate-binding protein [Candidatus Binatia bacterium]